MYKIKIAIFLVLCLLIASGCGGLQKQVAVSPEQGHKIIDIEASSFKFTPNNIKASQGDEILFRVKNVSGSMHNFTLKDPNGKIIKNVDLPGNEITQIEAILSESGKYEFYCNKTLHSSLGMTGQLEVVKK